jgi:1-acyl-sn-glycerol-3-phosphate acyltransferase
MAVKKFNSPFLNFLAWLGLIDFVYVLFGVFTIVKGRGITRNLEEARWIIKAGGNIVMYPEGKIVTEGGIGEFKVGATILAQQMSVPVLPISIRIAERGIFRKKLYINIGGPQLITQQKNTLTATSELRDVMVTLYQKSYT